MSESPTGRIPRGVTKVSICVSNCHYILPEDEVAALILRSS